MSKVHISSAGGRALCGAGARWMSAVITSVKRLSSRVTCKSCRRKVVSSVRADLLALADQNSERSLNILGHEVDRSDPHEVYGALVWIEDQLMALLEREREKSGGP